jgi:hypothetical protein
LRGAVAVKGTSAIPGIGISVEVFINLFVILGAFFFVTATIILTAFAFLLVFVFVVVVVLLWLFPAVAFLFFSVAVARAPFTRPRLGVVFVSMAFSTKLRVALSTIQGTQWKPKWPLLSLLVQTKSGCPLWS